MTTYTEAVSDSGYAQSSLSSTSVTSWALGEASSTMDGLKLSMILAGYDGASLTETYLNDVAQWLLDIILAYDAAVAQSSTLSLLDDWAAADALLYAAINELVSDLASGSETVTPNSAVLLSDILVASGIAQSQSQSNAVVAELITGLVSHERGGVENMVEGVSAQAAIAQFYHSVLSLLDSATAADGQVSYVLVTSTAIDTAMSADTHSLWQSLSAAVSDGAQAFVRFVADGEAYTGWVLNTQTGAATEYQGLNFNSLARIGTKYYGASETGVYELAGSTDAGADISTYIQSGLMDLGTSQQKAVTTAYLGVDVDGRIAVGVGVSEKTGIAEYWYEVTMDKDAPDNVKVPIGRGLKGRYWKFSVASEALTSFDSLTVLPLVLTRKV